eukprot:5635_1
MRRCVALFAYSFFIQWMHCQTDVWHEPMNSDPSQSALGWITTEATTPSWATDRADCPGTSIYCWFFLDVAGSYQLSASTTQFTSIQLTYSMSATGLNGQESCYIAYSVDDTIFTNIQILNTATPSITVPQTYDTWTGGAAAGISSLTIKIGSTRWGADCHFNELRLWGTPVTPQPTLPTTIPTKTPTAVPSATPSRTPSNVPSGTPTHAPSSAPSRTPSNAPTDAPTNAPSSAPSDPSKSPTTTPSNTPTAPPSASPSQPPSTAPSVAPSNTPSQPPSVAPSNTPSQPPSVA